MATTTVLPGFKECILKQSISGIGSGSHNQGATVRVAKKGEYYHYLNEQNAGLVRSKADYTA